LKPTKGGSTQKNQRREKIHKKCTGLPSGAKDQKKRQRNNHKEVLNA